MSINGSLEVGRHWRTECHAGGEIFMDIRTRLSYHGRQQLEGGPHESRRRQAIEAYAESGGPHCSTCSAPLSVAR